VRRRVVVKKRVVILVDESVAAEWHRLARAESMPLSTWLRIKTLGIDAGRPAQERQPAPKRPSELLGDRVLKMLGEPPELPRRLVPSVARTLGVSRRSLFGALGSLVAKGVMVYERGVFKVVRSQS
jgi:hypothetical protein